MGQVQRQQQRRRLVQAKGRGEDITATRITFGSSKRCRRGTVALARHLREPHAVVVKKPTADTRQRMCTRKRRYRTQADALDAAAVAGVERRRSAYRCPLCQFWHLTSA